MNWVKELSFDLFRQVDGSFTRKYEGMGINLATAKKLTNLLGGNIWVDSVLGEGSMFFFELPIEENANGLDRNMDQINGDSCLKTKGFNM